MSEQETKEKKFCKQWQAVEYIEARCPYCNNREIYRDGSAWAGDTLKCKICEEEFVLYPPSPREDEE